MFEDSLAEGVRLFPCRCQGTSRPTFQPSSSRYPSEMKKSACRLACAPSLSSMTDWDGQFRQRWSELSYFATIALITVQASLDLWRNAGRSTCVSLRLPCGRQPRTLAPPVVRRWILPRLGLRKGPRLAE